MQTSAVTRDHPHPRQALDTCYHCGLDIDDSTDISITIDNEKQPFCCQGCKAVCELIIAGGLDNYYQYRTAFADKREEPSNASKAFDEAAFQDTFCTTLNPNTGTIRARLIIENIHCAACVWLLESSCKSIPGLEDIKVNLTDGVTTLDWDNSATQLSHAVQRIFDLGYKAIPWSPDNKHSTQEKLEKSLLRRVALAGIAMMQVGMFSIALYAGDFQGIESEYQKLLYWFSALLTTPVVLYSAQPFYSGAFRSLRNGFVNMDVPVAAAITLAYTASVYAVATHTGKIYFDSVCMFAFLLLGVRYLELRARRRDTFAFANKDISPICKLLPHATASSHTSIPIHSVVPGNYIMVHTGEAIPTDGKLVSELATIDESGVSGEFLPVEKTLGSTLLSGTVNTSATLVMVATKHAKDSWLQSVQNLSLDAQQARPLFLQLTDQVARYFSLSIIIATSVAGVVWSFIDPSRVLEICISMLVISCPCALSLAAPTALAAASNYLRKCGVLICDGNLLEKLNKVTRICFDKTGTLTNGKFSLAATHLFNEGNEKEILSIAAALEAWSEHPIALAFSCSEGKPTAVTHASNVPSAGVSGYINTLEHRIGSLDYCKDLTHTPPPSVDTASESQKVWLANSDNWLACFELNDTARTHAETTMQSLSRFKPALLTGDTKASAQRIAMQLGMDDYRYQCTPTDKQAYIADLQHHDQTVMMVGDGINDLPVLAQADVSVAINSGNELAKNQADCVLLRNDLECIPLLFSHARSTYKIIRQNILWALAYNFGALPLSAIGLIPPWIAAIGMSLSSLVVILNAARLRKEL